MLTAQAIREAIEMLAPPAWAESWDNVGWQIGDDAMSVAHVHITLDLDEAVLDEARAHNADLIVSHHPLIFRPLSRIETPNLPNEYTLDWAHRHHALPMPVTSHTRAPLCWAGVGRLSSRRHWRLAAPASSPAKSNITKPRTPAPPG